MERLSESDKIKEKIKFDLEKLRLAIAAILTIGGGTISMVMDGHASGARILFIAAGIGLVVVSVVKAYKYYKAIKKEIR